MSDSNKSRKYKYFDPYKITEALVAEGAQIVYCREALYPIVEAQVRIREKSREQLGDIEKTILALLKTCPASPESISRLMGIGGGKLFPTIVELEGRSLIERGPNSVFMLSELGQLSIQYGVEVVDVDRALLLCGITGRLLPRKLYSVQRVPPDELKQRARFLDMVPEENSITLSALNVAKIDDRRAVNLTDETMEIIGILEYKPVFLRGILTIYRDQAQREIGEVVFPDEKIDWLPKEKLLEFASEPLGFSSGKAESQVLREIGDSLKGRGAELAQPINLDQYNNPVVEIKSISSDILGFDFNNKPFLMYFGTDKYPSVSIGKFPFGGEKCFKGSDLLCGRAITFKATGDELKEQVDTLRCMEYSVKNYYSNPPSERTVKLLDLITDNLAKNGLELSPAMAFGKKYGTRQLQKILSVEDDKRQG